MSENDNGNDQNTMVMEEPDRCIGCGWIQPVVGEGVELDVASTWLIIAIPNSVVWIYVCPKCGTCQGNKNAVENVRKLKKLQKSRIIQAKSPLFVPPAGSSLTGRG